MNHAANSRQISDKEAVVSRKRKLEKEKKTRASMILVFFFQCFTLSVGLTFTKKRTSDILQTVRIRKFTISIDLTRVK